MFGFTFWRRAREGESGPVPFSAKRNESSCHRAKSRAVVLCTRMRDVEREIPLSLTRFFACPIPPCNRIQNEIVASNVRCVQRDADHCQWCGP
jgi:hypothetical protein